jgi:hypothetical protein
MAVAVVMDFTGATLDQYDQVLQKMHLDAGGPLPTGGLFHWAAATDGGLRVVDVWETREQYEAFAAEQIGPYTREVGIPAPPEISFYDVHNYMVEGAAASTAS